MHRDWYTERLGDLLQEAGHPMAGDGADELMLARDGAMSGAYAGDAIAATAALQRVADRVLPEQLTNVPTDLRAAPRGVPRPGVA